MAEVKVLGVRDDNFNNVAAGTAKSKDKVVAKKKKEKLSALCKTPPSLIKNNEGKGYRRGDLLGEGGFARCFQVKSDRGQLYAAKTVAKASLTAEKTKAKLVTEIEIHRSLKHKAIVEFIDCFEDDANVYILLEMCSSANLFDMVKQRKSLTTSEVKLYTMQILAGVKYMHDNNVIHRDLKLGNIFLDHNMNLKIGDFGLASRLTSPNERRKTICGTPNYIAPEILYNRDEGHSFEVDIWSIGIIIYAMLYGKPPFQCKDVSEIYDRIKQLDYAFPVHAHNEAEDLIESILLTEPGARLTVQEIVQHGFFRRKDPFPDSIPRSALMTRPTFQISPEKSDNNYRKYRDFVLSGGRKSTISGTMRRSLRAISNIQVMADNNRTNAANSEHILPESISPASTKEKYRMVMVPQKGVRNVKDKIMVTSGSEEELDKNPAEVQFGEKSPVSSGTKGTIVRENLGLAAKTVAENEKHTSHTRSVSTSSTRAATGYPGLPPMDRDQLAENCDRLLKLSNTLNAERKQSYSKETVTNLTIMPAEVLSPVFVSKWVDFSKKEGLAYQLSNGQVGILSFHGSTISFDPSSNEYWRHTGYDVDPSRFQSQKLTESHRKIDYHNDIKMLKAYYNYMMKNLCQSDNCALFKPEKPVVVRRHLRQGAYVVFELSNGSFQFNFPDHYKLLVSRDGKFLTIIDPDRAIHGYTMHEAFKACRPVSEENMSEATRLFRQCKISHKLDYCEQKIKRLWMRDSSDIGQ